jgi:hypothetical protein
MSRGRMLLERRKDRCNSAKPASMTCECSRCERRFKPFEEPALLLRALRRKFGRPRGMTAS